MQETHKRPQKAQRVAHTNGCHLPAGVQWLYFNLFLIKIIAYEEKIIINKKHSILYNILLLKKYLNNIGI